MNKALNKCLNKLGQGTVPCPTSAPEGRDERKTGESPKALPGRDGDTSTGKADTSDKGEASYALRVSPRPAAGKTTQPAAVHRHPYPNMRPNTAPPAAGEDNSAQVRMPGCPQPISFTQCVTHCLTLCPQDTPSSIPKAHFPRRKQQSPHAQGSQQAK